MSIIITNETARQVLHIAKSVAKENYHEYFGGAHVLLALMHGDIGLRDFIAGLGKDPNYVYDWADVRIEELPKTMSMPTEALQEAAVEDILTAADDIRLKLGMDEVTPLCMLAAILKPGIAFDPAQLKSLPLKEQEILAAYAVDSDRYVPVVPGDSMTSPADQASMTALQQYCTDKTSQARAGKLDAIIGRERETRNLIEVLCRRSKPNLLITGEPGVGKTALVEGFAHEIISGRIPGMLANAVLLELDTSKLLAGTVYKGEVEDRLKKVIAACKRLEKAILFIDEIHALLDNKGGAGNVANLLKPELARGGITIIGATTHEEYRKIIEPEQAFNRRFEVLQVDEPDAGTCVKMISIVVDHYKSHHHIGVDKDALPECVRLAKRYAKGKRLPDAAIDLLDRTMAAIRMLDERSDRELEQWKQEYDNKKESQYEEEAEYLLELKWMYDQLKNRISPILWGSLREQPELTNVIKTEEAESIIESVYDELLGYAAIKREKVGKLELAAVMAAKANIPIGKIQAQEKERLLHMESHLRKRVVGQDHALKVLSDAIVENRSGLNKPGQPIGSFFLLGPTGTGKTELAKSMAELLFNDEKAMIRFDMSEFKEEHSAALLYGAPPGYVGYEEGGMLVNKIRQQPYAVVLFDEIEKAHQSVFDVFLQIMDEGKIHDKLGKEGDFSNALILFTSNIGSQDIVARFERSEIPSSGELMQVMSSKFRPEFLARITEIVPFGPITEDIAGRIFRIQLKALIQPLQRLGITFTISDDAVHRLATMGFSSQYGARQIGGIIRSQLTRPISRKIVSDEIRSGQELHVTWDELQGQIDWQVLEAQPESA